MISFLLLTLGFICSSFSSCFRCRVRLSIQCFSCFLMNYCIAINFPLRTAFAESLKFWVIMFSLSFVSRNLLISFISLVTSLLFSNVLFNIHEFLFIAVFFFFMQLISSLTALWSEKIYDTISIFLNLLRLDLWPKMWSLLENVPCALQKKVYSSAFGWRVLKISIMSIWSNVSFKVSVSLLILCFDYLSNGVSGVLKSTTIILLLSISPLMPVSVSLMY